MKLTNEEKNKRIAEACGWKLLTWVDKKDRKCSGWQDPAGNQCVDPRKIPKYFECLNAMHEAEKMLTPEQWVSYWSFLEPLACRPNNTSILHATAAQRAEAFGLTLNLWEAGE